MQVPEGWKLASLIETIDTNKKKSFCGGPFGSDLKSEHYTDSGVRIIQLQNIGEGRFIDKSKVYTTTEKADELINCNIYPNEIILKKMMPVARSCMVPNTAKRFLMCSDGIRLSVDKERFSNLYVFHFLNSNMFLSQAEEKTAGTTRARIGLSDLKELNLLIPPLPEQKKIAEILSACDVCIENTEKQIAKLKDLKKATMQELLTKGIGHTEFKDSPLGRIPKSWGVVRLEDVTTYSQGIQVDLSMQINEPKEGYIKFLRIENYTQLSQDFRFVPQDLSRNKFINNDDVVVVRYGATAGYVGRGFEGILANNLFKVSPNEELLTKGFIYYIILNLYECFQNLMSGGAMPALSFGMLNEIKISLPPLSEQIKITETISSIDSNIENKEQKLSKLKDQKKALMNDLLTGKVRVK